MSGYGVGLGARILSGQGREFADLLDGLDEAITVCDQDDRFVYANRAALRGFGLSSLDELVGRRLSALLDGYVIKDEKGTLVTHDDLPSVRLRAGQGPAEPLLVQMVDRVTGETKWQILKSSPLRDADGAIIAAVTMIENVTAVKTAEVHERVLAESGRLLSASLDYEQTLRNATRAALPGLADWCVVELVDRGTREELAIAHADPADAALIARLRALEEDRSGPRAAVRRVIATGESEVFADVTDADLRTAAVSDAQLEVLRTLDIRSVIIVPMRVPARIIGAMSFFTSGSRRRLSDADVELAEQLGRRAAVAVENSRLHTTLTRVAQTLQDSLRPSELPQVPGWEIAALYRPAVADRRVEVGGDFYEVFVTDGSAFAMLGDVTGHGVPAATTTALMRHGARFASHLERDPVAILRRLDEELRRDHAPMCTALCAALHDHELALCSAGHPPALIVDRAGTVTEAPETGPLLGAFADSDWPAERITLGDGDVLLMYTDGVTEAAGAAERYGTDRLRAFLAAHAGSSPAELLEALEAELERFRGGEATDDVAALALRPQR